MPTYLLKPAVPVAPRRGLGTGLAFGLPLLDAGPSPRDVASGLVGTANGTVARAAGPFGPCLDHSGTLPYIAFSGLPSLTGNAATFAVWLRIRAMDTNGVVVFGTNTGSNVFWQLAMPQTSVAVMGTSLTIPTASIADSLWHHHAFTAGPGGIAYYRDGAPIASSASAGGSLAAGSKNFRLGGWLGGAGWSLNGQLDLPKLWARKLTAAEVAADYLDAAAVFRPAPQAAAFTAAAGAGPPAGPNIRPLAATLYRRRRIG